MVAKGVQGFLCHKLTEARKMRRKNGSVLAEEIGVTRAAISAYENGKKNPSADVLGRLSSCLDMPINYFLTDPIFQVDPNTPTFFRSYSSVTKLARESADEKYKTIAKIVAYLERFAELPMLNLPNYGSIYDPTALSEEDVRSFAVKLREFWGLSLGPISDLICLVENNGIIVSSFPFDCNSLDAFSQGANGQFYIVFGSDKGSCVRQRFDVAHELGHLILHRNLTKDLVKGELLALIERQANIFAFEFLFPSEAFESEVGRINLNEFLRLKEKWKVSIAAQIFRAAAMDGTTHTQISNLQRLISAKGWRKSEPLDDELEKEKPRLIRESFDLVFSEKLATPQDIANLFSMHFSDLEEICGLPEGYFHGFMSRTRVEPKASNSRPELCREQTISNKNSKIIDFMEALSKRK
jgi:Zn-dependent peptidase ImmA (M78 family)/DNA-binding XRE family transcriptional regulator